MIDKDLSAALLAGSSDADALLMLTDVDASRTAGAPPCALSDPPAHPDELRELQFAAGSMAPKVEAACRFVEAPATPR